MINYDSERKIIRTCSAPFEFVDEKGELKTEEIRVEYYSLSTKKLKEMREAAEARQKANPDEPQWFSEIMAGRIHSLPDLADKKGSNTRLESAGPIAEPRSITSR